MGLAIAYGVALSIPVDRRRSSALLVWGGAVPRAAERFEPRLFIAHVFVLPAVLGRADRACTW